MNSLAITLGGGVLLEFVVFSMLYRWTRLPGKSVAFLVASLGVALFLPLGILRWQGLDDFAIHVTFYMVIPYVLGIITSHWEIRASLEGPSTGRWFHWGPAMLVGFFVVLAAVDGVILTLAQKGIDGHWSQRLLPKPRSHANVVSVFPGSVSHDFQEKEAQFNQYLKAREAQRALGWQVDKGWVGQAVAGQPVEFRVRVRDRNGQPVSGAIVSGRFLRPSDSRKDVGFSMTEIGGGEYSARLRLSQPGRWWAVIDIRKGQAWYEVRARTRLLEPKAND